MNNYEGTYQLYDKLREANLIPQFLLLQRIRYSNISSGKIKYDLNGGFIHKSSLQDLAKKLEIPYNTLRQRISEFKKLGWVIKNHTGWAIISWRKIASQYTEQLNKIKLFAKTKKELLNVISFQKIKKNLKQQFYAKYKFMSERWQKKHSKPILTEQEYSLSVRTVAKMMGYKSPVTGSRIEKRLVKAGKIKIEKHFRTICPANEYHLAIKAMPELAGRCFFYQDKVVERLCNNIILL